MGAENRLFLNQPEADILWKRMVGIAKQETQGLDNSHTHIQYMAFARIKSVWACCTAHLEIVYSEKEGV